MLKAQNAVRPYPSTIDGTMFISQADSLSHAVCLSLVPSSRLERLYLDLREVCESTNYDWLIRCLSQVTSNTFKTLKISFLVKHDSPVDTAVARIGQACCARLDGVLSSLRAFSNCEGFSLTLWVFSGHIHEARAQVLGSQLMSRMPRLCERGSLECVLCYSNIDLANSQLAFHFCQSVY